MTAHLVRGDARMLPFSTGLQVDAIVTDPPAGIGFMGVAWDTYSEPKGTQGHVDDAWDWQGSKERPRTADAQQRVTAKQGRLFRESMRPVFERCLELLKPGGHAFVWALPRTSHWTATALEDAGFEIRDVVVHLFGSGFPKSLDVGKAIDKAARRDYVLAAVRLGLEVPGRSFDDWTKEAHSPSDKAWEAFKSVLSPDEWQRVEREVVGTDRCSAARIAYVRETGGEFNLTAPATPAAARWSGWGTALKPASEHWILCRKPLSEPTVAANVLAHGVGGLNVAGCRVGTTKNVPWSSAKENHGARDEWGFGQKDGTGTGADPNVGRWPANVTLSHNDGCEQVGVKRVKGNRAPTSSDTRPAGREQYRMGDGYQPTGYASPDGTETVPAYRCTDGCAVAMLDAQSGTLTSGGTPERRYADKFRSTYGDFKGGESENGIGSSVGGSSRFFYTAKASPSERNLGLPVGTINSHPTVKPLALCDWLIRLITPPGGLVLDPFMGSGSVGCSAVRQGFRFIGIDQDENYVKIARRRIAYWAAQGRQTDMFAEVGA